MRPRKEPKHVHATTLDQVLVLGPREEQTKAEEAEARREAILRFAGFKDRTWSEIVGLLERVKHG